MKSTEPKSPPHETPAKQPVRDQAELQRRLQAYYQLECLRPTSQRMQLFLDQFLRKAAVSPELDHRAESSGNH
jgi:hypothetical protein